MVKGLVGLAALLGLSAMLSSAEQRAEGRAWATRVCRPLFWYGAVPIAVVLLLIG